MKTIAGSGLIFLLTAGVAFAQAKNPKVAVDQETGVIIYRPSGEEWSCKKAGEGDDDEEAQDQEEEVGEGGRCRNDYDDYN